MVGVGCDFRRVGGSGIGGAVKAGRIEIKRVFRTEFRGFRVHHGNKSRNASGDFDGKYVRGVVCAGDEQGIEQILHRDFLAGFEPEHGAAFQSAKRRGAYGDDGVKPPLEIFQCEDSRHDFGGGARRGAAVRLFGENEPSVLHIIDCNIPGAYVVCFRVVCGARRHRKRQEYEQDKGDGRGTSPTR